MSYYFKIYDLLYPSGEKRPNGTPQFRLRPISRDPNNPDALAMRLADPLWMLGRQWQFGEFKGEDNGSPVAARTFYRKAKVEYYSTTKNGSHRKPLDQLPLEAKIEAVNVPSLDLKSKVRIGQQYEQLIKDNFSKSKAGKFIHDLRALFPLTHEKWKGHDLKNENGIDGKSLRFFRLMKGRVVDGKHMLENIIKNGFPKKNVGGVNDQDFAELGKLTEPLVNWYNSLVTNNSDNVKTWNANQLSHQFKLHTEKKSSNEDVNLVAPDYQSGHLDWYSFDDSTVKLDPEEETKLKESEYYPPVNVSFASMPDKRLFSFEDSKIDLTKMDVDTSDILKMMLVEFSLVSGSDWYTIPLEMELGELCWINKIEVKDVFGVTTEIKHYDEKDKQTKGVVLNEESLKVWDVFKIRDNLPTEYDPKQHFLFIAPATTFHLESEPIEEVLFLRDEYANMVWALENRIPNAMGQPVDGFDLHLELYGPFLPPDKEDDKNNPIPIYRLANTVPSNWIPYLPEHLPIPDAEMLSDHNIQLVAARMLRNELDEEPTDIKTLTYLASEDLKAIREEAIPKAGVRVQLTRQRVRWTDGKTYVWTGRKILTGRGEGNSGLEFDYLKE